MSRRSSPVAIVGMGCHFPGSPDLATFWDNILAARDQTREAPASRFGARARDALATPSIPFRGGYLDEPLVLDSAGRGVMPRTASGGEPEQFLILETGLAALADAGVEPGTRGTRNVEIVIGRGNYFNRGNLTRLQHGRGIEQALALLESLHPEWTEADRRALRDELRSSLPPFEAATIPGQLTNATAGRLAQRLRSSGASYVVDAASASALVALDLACRALDSGRADLAITGGVYLEADVDFPLVFRQLGVVSPTGLSRPFTADADGMIPGEGAGVVVLKRLKDAVRSGDRVYAVVRGVGVASDGSARSLAAPSARGHARAMRGAYRQAGVDPASVMLIEGHGLGAPASDRAELKALGAVFPRLAHGRRALGAVSSLIGHAMPAAGSAGLIKTALALFHRVLPPSPKADAPHPLVDQAGFALHPRSRPWIHSDPDSPRRAGVNAFGFAAVNAHAALEEHAPSALSLAPGALRRWESEVVLLAAPDRRALAERARSVAQRLENRPGLAMIDVAYTLNRELDSSLPARLGLAAGSPTELVERLKAAAAALDDPRKRAIRDGRGVYYFEPRLLDGQPSRLAFLFPGEGSQYPGMLAELALHFPEVVARFDVADRIARELGETTPPSDYLFSAAETDSAGLWQTATAVNVVLSAQWAVYQLLLRLGLRPDAVVGHSSGELLALAAAGVLEVDRGLERSLSRLGAIFRGFERSDSIPAARLAAVGAARETVESLARELGLTGVVVAMDNCPHQVVAAGTPDDIDRLTGQLAKRNILCEILPFERAYHTPGFEAVMAPVAAFFANLDLSAPTIPIYSCALRGPMSRDLESLRSAAVAQWTHSVDFRDTILAMHDAGCRLFIDVGARGNLAGFVDDTLRGKPAFAIASSLPRRGGIAQLNQLAAAAFAQGAPLDWSFLFARRRPRAIDWKDMPRSSGSRIELKLGFPELALSAQTAERLASRPAPHRLDLHPPIDDEPSIDRAPLDADDAVMLDYQATMRLFLETQKAVLSAHLSAPDDPDRAGQEIAGDWLDHAPVRFDFTATGPLPLDHDVPLEEGGQRNGQTTLLRRASRAAVLTGPIPGPWVGSIVELEPGTRVVARFTLDVHADPIARHHTLGGRKTSALDPELKGLPVVPFTMMAEMAAQAAALVAAPGLVLVKVVDALARKWVRYEAEPVVLEMRARRLDSARDERIEVSLFNRGIGGRDQGGRAVFEAALVFAPETPEPEPATHWAPTQIRPCRFTAQSMYAEGWLFHGPPMQATARMGPISEHSIEGALRVMPFEPIVPPGTNAQLHIDAIILDTYTHLLGCWGLDWQADRGDVMFPLSMAELTILGDRPAEGELVSCRITIEEVEHHRVRASAEIVRPDETVWMRIEGWEDWRFHWPGRFRDAFRQAQNHLVGEPLELAGALPREVQAVWLEPPLDMARPVWRDVLEQTQLGPRELERHRAAGGPEPRRAERLFGRVAAKEAVRRLWQAHGLPPTYPVDLEVQTNAHGKPSVIRLDDPAKPAPAVSFAHKEGVAVALATTRASARPGIDVELIAPRDASFESAAFDATEQELLDQAGRSNRPAWQARFWCAKEAAAKSTGQPLGPRQALVRAIDPATGTIAVEIVPAAQTIRVFTAERASHAWAWTLGERINP